MIVPSALTPTRLRLILSVSLVLVVLAGGGIFYLAYNRLSDTAKETGKSAASARESQDTLERLQSLKKELDEKKAITERASRVVANSQDFAYQDILVRDITTYASRANLVIKNISFSNPTNSAAPAAEGQAAAPAGLTKATVDITLETPVNYESLLNFIHYIEQNLTKLKISKVAITKNEANSVTTDILNLEVYIQ